ncbi:ubiquitin carboxyl-terminal hydrolase 36-like [Dendronephthya gigantea]|uniref:ubiquitin carboxyl-terminal hydrolase 36-like n=1 Tax=Dendronephthya gigantea TaxID=151771 RepID=UPI001069C509|nr:ubiquitin carboxyl-terminal hydrolase 36-like [Dendronephthya gigantea]
MENINTRKRKTGGNYCVAGGPSKVSCKNNSYTDGVSMHYFPKNEDLRKKWTNFVRKHRKDFEPSKKSCLCSAHFEDECYENRPSISFADLPNIDKPPRFKQFLIKGSVPTKDVAGKSAQLYAPPSARQRRQILKELNASQVETLPHDANSSPSSLPNKPSTEWPSPSVTPVQPEPITSAPTSTSNLSSSDQYTWSSPVTPVGAATTVLHAPGSTKKPVCHKCVMLRKKCTSMKRKNNRLKVQMQHLKNKVKQLRKVQRKAVMETGSLDDKDTTIALMDDSSDDENDNGSQNEDEDEDDDDDHDDSDDDGNGIY